MKVSPSLLSADFLHLAEDVEFVSKYADLAHLDVMDGSLVPNISYGFPVADAIGKECRVPMDMHLMIVHPEKYFERCRKCGVSMLSFHLEAARKARKDPAKLLRSIKALGMKAGIAINPDIPVKSLFPYLKDADFVLIMSVFAGFGGQKFISESLDRVAAVKAEIRRQGAKCEIEVDGGVDTSNCKALKEAGADILVAGSSIFKSEDRIAAVKFLREC